MKWDKNQELAIDTTGKSILVNAGAGTGKTAVLTERLLRKVESGAELKNLIVLTFTVLAAQEMKERLRKALTKSESEKAKEQLKYIDQANIQTIDGFTNYLVKKYHYLLGISNEINIVDEVNFKMKQKKFLDEIIDEYYKTKNEDFALLINKHTKKNDVKLKENLLFIYDKLEKIPNYEVMFEQKTQDDYFNNVYDNLKNEYLELLKNKQNDLNEYVEELRNCINLFPLTEQEPLEAHFNKLNISLFTTSYNTYDDYKNIATFKNEQFQESRIKKQVSDYDLMVKYKSIYEELKKQVTSFKNTYLIYEDEKEMEYGYKSTIPFVKISLEILHALDTKMKEFKKEKQAYSFNDIAQMAIKLLSQNKTVRESLKNTEILIDEYQDTSDIQETLINLIENEKEKENVYMVGDVKQSIYRFRHANPTLFVNKQQVLFQKDPTSVITLSKNFRSRCEVLNFVNDLFKEIMIENIGRINYKNGHSLESGFKPYQTCNASNYETEILLYDKELNEEDMSDEEKEAIEEAQRSEIEAFIIANDIEKKIKEGFMVYDKAKDEYRVCNYGDFAIIPPKKKTMDIYNQIFKYKGIPLVVYGKSDLKASTDLRSVYSLFRLIYCFKDTSYGEKYAKEAIVSALRSFIFEVPDDRIYEIVSSKKPLYSLSNLEKNIYNNIVSVANQIDILDLNSLIDLIYEKFAIYEKMLKLPQITDNEFRLNYIFKLIANFKNLDYSFGDVVAHLDDIIFDSNFEIDIKDQVTKGENVVTMMNIHISKGLEFPICYFPDLYLKFSKRDISRDYLYSKKYGVIFPYLKQESSECAGVFYYNIARTLDKEENIKENISEYIRLLYVAFTRAREKVIIVMPKPKKELLVKNENKLLKAQSYVDILYYANLQEKGKMIDLNSLDITDEYKNDKKKVIPSIKRGKVEFSDFTLEKQVFQKRHASHETTTFLDKETLENLKKGTTLHKMFEVIDFKNPNFENIDSSSQKLIKAFFECGLFDINKIKNVYHEYPFTFEKDDITTNGIIDLIIEEEDRFLIIDYKMTNIDDENYQKQLNIYIDYLESISNKKVEAYLYSIMQKKYKKVEKVEV